MLVETYEEGDHISRYISTPSTINHKLSLIGSGTMLKVRLAVVVSDMSWFVVICVLDLLVPDLCAPC